MSQLMCNLLRHLPSITENTMKTSVGSGLNVVQVRHRKLLYPRKYVEPNFVKKQMLAVCEPIFARDKRQESDRCLKLKPVASREIHPYDRLLAEDMKQELRTSRMVCFFHQNVMNIREKKLCSNLFQHEDMFLRYYNPDIAQLAMSATKYETALHLCCQRDVTILFSAEPKVATLLKVNRKCPQLILMAAIIDDRFLSLEDIKEYNRLPDLPQLRAQLSHTLSMATQSITNKTISTVSGISNSLDLYLSQQKK